MATSTTRRTLVGAIALGATGIGPLCVCANAATGSRPFCRFSLRDGWTDEAPAEYITHRARDDDVSGVPQVVSRIKRVFEIKSAIEVYIAKQEDNAFATVAGGRKLLIIDVGFLSKMNRTTKTEWAAIQVIAHEIGHHIAGFSGTAHTKELNADYWSGQALRRLGAAKSAATRGILTFGTDFDTPTHPNKTHRAEVIAQGWDDAAKNRIDYNFCDDCR